jgi:hypothetical protein
VSGVYHRVCGKYEEASDRVSLSPSALPRWLKPLPACGIETVIAFHLDQAAAVGAAEGIEIP